MAMMVMRTEFSGPPPSLTLPLKGGGDKNVRRRTISNAGRDERIPLFPSLPPLRGKVRKGGGHRLALDGKCAA